MGRDKKKKRLKHMNESTDITKKRQVIYLCYENPYNQTYLVHDESGKFSILTKDQVQANVEGYIFKKDLETRTYIELLLKSGFDLRELTAFLPVMIQLKNNYKDED